MKGVIGKNPRILKSGETSPDTYQELWKAITSGKEWHGEFHNCKRNGEKYWEYASISPIVDRQGRIMNFLAVKAGITARKEMEEALRSALETIKEQQKRTEAELKQAHTTQLSLLPHRIPELSHARISVKFVSMDQIGGDFYDFLNLGHQQTGFLIADVTGHGIAVALIAAMFSSLFRTLSTTTSSPQETLETLNRLAHPRMQPGKLATVFYGVYDDAKQLLTRALTSEPTVDNRVFGG